MTPDSPDPSEVLSNFTGHPVKLVMRPLDHKRPVDLGVGPDQILYDGGVQTVFADFAPLMLVSLASLADIQDRVEIARKGGEVEWDSSRPLTIDRWRPNVVVEGKPPR